MKINDTQQRLLRAIESLESARDNLEINRIVEELVTEVTGAERSSIWMNEYPLLVREREEGVREVSMERKEGLLYRCFVTKEPAIYNYITSEKGYLPEIDNPDAIRIKSKITIPLILKDQLLGIVTCYSSVRRIKNFSLKDLEKFQAVIPFVIDAMLTMQRNRGRKISADRRVSHRPDSGLRRRGMDLLKKIETIEKSPSDKRSSQEIQAETASIVHDIRTPANNLMGFLELLEEQIDDARLREYLEHAKNSARMINELTTSILDRAAMRLKESPEKSTVNSVKYFAEIGEIFSARMYEKRIHYTIFIDPRIPREIEVERMKLKRVLMNLIGNAVKFTPEQGSIDFAVRYKSKDRSLHFSVTDSGIGIPEAKQKEIFKAFTQAEETTKEKYGGTGLGLAISAEYVREMGGKLQLESEVEKGSAFFFTLPVGIVDAAPKMEPVDTQALSIVILTDDETLPVAKSLARYMVKMGVGLDRIRAVREAKSIPSDTTHLIYFQRRMQEGMKWKGTAGQAKKLLVEEKFLSLNESEIGQAALISRYGFYGEKLYAFIAPRRPLRILVVDDDRISVELVKTILQEAYCLVDTASDGREGSEKLEAALSRGKAYDLLFSDLNMPGLSGAEMIRKYRKLEESCGATPLQTVSISGDAASVETGVFDHYATKPFRREEILSLVRTIQNQIKE